MIEFIYMSSEVFGDPRSSVSSAEFRAACGCFASGVTIATVVDGAGEPHGLTVSSFTSVSLEPPMVSICLGHSVTVIDVFRAAKFFAINILAENQQVVSQHFARKGHDRFQGVGWTVGETGAPLLEGVLVAIECEVEQRVAAGDHDILVGRMVATRINEGAPLVYFSGAYRKLEL
jgi:flavin reductase (DIM6/NTAB) family NADH-FMN oxidoreductase RutF